MTKVPKAALLIKADGTRQTVIPRNQKKFSLEEMQKMVGGYIEMVSIKDRLTMIINEESAINGSPRNEEASRLWLEKYPLNQFPMNNLGAIYGDVIVGKGVF